MLVASAFVRYYHCLPWRIELTSREAATMKTGPDFNLTGYAPVAERITQFYEAHPRGRIVTELVSRTATEVVFRASVYRDASESGPAATGWAAEREGDGDVNEVACLENTETSAVGRALANLGFTASRLRPSAEEMAKAARARARIGRQRLVVREPVVPPVSPSQAMYLGDLLNLVAAAERIGLRPARAARWRRHLHDTSYEDRELVQFERRLRDWIVRNQTPGALMRA
jgi:hypothetical protein